MSRDLSTVIKQLAQQSADNNKYTNLTTGEVISVSPLKIKITQELTLPESVLIVPQHLTDYEVPISVTSNYGWITEDTMNGSSLQSLGLAQNHKHDIKLSQKKIKVHGKLKVGDKVALINAIGGQLYYVLDRI